MILALSRFRVANGLGDAVRQAFLDRPRLVDGARGFLGLETFTSADDPAIFYLVTRWTDAACFHAWHRSGEHHSSHAGIPKGLKLEARFTELVCLDRIEAPAGPTGEERVLDAAWLLARFVGESAGIHTIVADDDGTIAACNRAVEDTIGAVPPSLVGRPLWPLLTEPDATLLQRVVAGGAPGADGRLRLNFLPADGDPFTIECRIATWPGGFLLVGEPAAAPRRDGERALRVNNDLATLARENARQAKELEHARAKLEQAMTELEASHWHLKKIQEVLPICMECGKVKTGDLRWEAVADYLRKSALFLTHGYCPECAAIVRRRMKAGPGATSP